jgi:NAD(P)-dependent dehydrogenase (short-subunit alcohol dehydrogenase family)
LRTAPELPGAVHAVSLKPVEEQVIVIVGASSGIGLATARTAADRGAKLVLVARNGEALKDIVEECEAKGTKAIAVAADAANRDDLLRVAEEATRTFGGFDTWINNAAVAVYGKLEEVPLEDQRQLFEVNYWGVVYGSLIAAKTLRSRGGAIINTGSVLSERAMISRPSIPPPSTPSRPSRTACGWSWSATRPRSR